MKSTARCTINVTYKEISRPSSAGKCIIALAILFIEIGMVLGYFRDTVPHHTAVAASNISVKEADATYREIHIPKMYAVGSEPVSTQFITNDEEETSDDDSDPVRCLDEVIEHIQEEETICESMIKENEVIEQTTDNAPIIIMSGEQRASITKDELDVFTRVVEAEVTGTTYNYNGNVVSEEDMLYAKVRVAQVYLNRLENNESFKGQTSLMAVLTAENASATFKDGRYYRVAVTDLTKEAVAIALDLNTPDYTDGALFFSSGTTKCKYGDYMFTDCVGHSFFK